ncbi:MAG: hypothetical protein K8S23_00755 [Candidatus Cloacimonetes bacterium]|nr:hypothetical protein [Candidatus Cloacimonadota bacterium]
MIKKTILILLLSLIFLPIFCKSETSEKTKKISFTQKFIDKNSEKQFEIRQKMTKLMIQLKKKQNRSLLLSVLFIAFLYGIFHALGPGHGKILISSSFLAENTKIIKGLSAGIVFAFTHSLSGLLLVVVLKLLSQSVLKSTDDFVLLAQKVSLVILILLGIFMFIKAFRKPVYHDKHKSILVTILAIGLVPCPGSMIIAMFALRLEMYSLGIFMVLSMAVGMAVIISLIGILTVIFKESFIRLFRQNNKLQLIIYRTVNIIGSLALIGFAVLFLV